MTKYHLFNEFGIRKQRIKNCIPENNDDPDDAKTRELLARRTQEYTAEELELLFGRLWTSHHECVDENPQDYYPIQVKSARDMIDTGRAAIAKLVKIRGAV